MKSLCACYWLQTNSLILSKCGFVSIMRGGGEGNVITIKTDTIAMVWLLINI